MADYNTGGKGANLVFTAANAMSDTATLTLYGNTGTLVTFNANDTIGGLKLNGVKQLPGTYNSGNSTWLAGTGTLTVTGADHGLLESLRRSIGNLGRLQHLEHPGEPRRHQQRMDPGTNRRVQCRWHLRRDARRHQGNRRPGGVQRNRDALRVAD